MIEDKFDDYEESVKQWFLKLNWNENPFTFKISPDMFTGYEVQIKAILKHISEQHKIAILTGPTGAGKTTMLKWTEAKLKDDKIKMMYLSKPPSDPSEFVRIFTNFFGRSIIERIFMKEVTIFNLSDYINRKLGSRHLVLLVDEAHETNKNVLEWLRILVDQIENVSMVLAGLPLLEDKIKNKLETLDQRITTRIKLTSLNMAETRELIRRRIESVGGEDIKPFTEESVSQIFRKTGGFPREVIKLCDKLVNDAIEKNVYEITADNISEYKEISEEPVSKSVQPKFSLKELPYKQRKVLEILSDSDWLTPSEVAERLGGSYKSEYHAIRSMNNILKRLMKCGFVERETKGKTFIYKLTPKIKTLLVEA